MATYNYGKDATGNPVYESSTPGGAVTPSNAISAIPTASLGTAPAPISVPPPPASTDIIPHYMQGAATIAGNTAATATAPTPPSYDPATGKVTDYGKSQGITDPTATTPSIWDKLFASSTPPPSVNSQYQSDYAAAGIDQKQTDTNTAAAATKAAQAKLAAISAQLQGLTAKGQAMNLAVEGQGGLQGQLSGAQAENNRKIAIEAMPLQAQALAAQAEVAAAQGNQQLAQSILQQAQQHLDTVFQIHQQDATNQYNYQKDLRDQALQHADKEQAAQLAQQDKVQSQNLSLYNAAVSDLRAAASTATADGQGALAGKLAQLVTSLDPSSKTFKTDLVKVNTQLATYQSQLTKPAKAPTTTPGTFTTTQLNKGAANAGVPITEFKNLSADDKNYFVNSYAQFKSDQKAITSGTQTKEQVAGNIRTSNLSPAVKTILLKQLGAPETAAKTGGGALDAVSNWFGGAWKALTGS